MLFAFERFDYNLTVRVTLYEIPNDDFIPRPLQHRTSSKNGSDDG
jgi:hypothetical protein